AHGRRRSLRCPRSRRAAASWPLVPPGTAVGMRFPDVTLPRTARRFGRSAAAGTPSPFPEGSGIGPRNDFPSIHRARPETTTLAPNWERVTSLSADTTVRAPAGGRSPASDAASAGARERRRREYLLFLAFVAPNVVLLAVFSYWPIVYNGYLSLTSWDLLSEPKPFVGLANYV